ncbi:MAG TPA: hypothetical protein VMF87_27760 [Streptosporangiaceae bacterium]|nr:hypothetical protein [Streptosporangiaceae bacterium]
MCHGPAARPQTFSNPACTLPANAIPEKLSTRALNTLVVLSTRAGVAKSRVTAVAEDPVRPMP